VIEVEWRMFLRLMRRDAARYIAGRLLKLLWERLMQLAERRGARRLCLSKDHTQTQTNRQVRPRVAELQLWHSSMHW